MKVLSYIENKDGSANLEIDMTVEEQKILIELGFITALKKGIEHCKDTNASPDNITNEY